MIISKKTVLFAISLLTASILGAQNQVGQDLLGDTVMHKLGSAIELNYDGSILAVGTSNSDANGLVNNGLVEVFEYTNGSWVQIGEDITGTNQLDDLGGAVALSKDGSRFAAGARDQYVRVFENVNGTWTQIGNDLSGGRADNFGTEIAISANADTIAVSAPDYEVDAQQSGQVKVFYNNQGAWEQLGADIYAPEFETRYGYTLQMSADGATIAIGSSNEVTFYEFQDGAWVLTSSIAIDAGLRASMRMNPNGNVIAIGNGVVRIYRKGDDNTWTQIGSNLQFGSAVRLKVDINDAGDIVVVGNRYDETGGSQAGHFRVYNLQDGEWVEDIQKTLTGDVAYEQLGSRVAISGNGNFYSVGAFGKDIGETANAGLVRVYDMAGVTGFANEPTQEGKVTVSPNPAEDVIMVSMPAEHVLKSMKMYNLQGQVVASSQSNQLELHHLDSGTYIIIADTNKGRFMQKVLKR